MGAPRGYRYAGMGAVAVCATALSVWIGSPVQSAGAPARRVSAAVAITARPGGSSVRLERIAGQRVRSGYGEIVRVGQLVVVSGSVTRPAARARVQLQSRITRGWHRLLTSPVRGAHFRVHWRVREPAFQLRAVLLSRRHRIAVSPIASVLVGPAIVRCRPAPTPTTLPAGDGWIAGGVYLRGGPAPGLDECQRAASTVTATSVNGSTGATQQLAGGSGYALVLPAGTYALRDGACTGQATVVAGQRTVADTTCNFP